MDNEFFYKINRDYIEIKDILDDYEKTAEYFKINEKTINDILFILRSSRDNGHIEARESLLRKIYSILEEGIFKVITQEKLDEIYNKSSILLFITIIVRNIYYGNFIFKEINDRDDEFLKKSDELDIKSIILYLTNAVKDNKELLSNKYYKDIIIKIKNYNTEVSKISELEKNIKEDKKELFLINAKKTLDDLISSIKKNYLLLHEYLFEKNIKLKNNDNLLKQLKFNSVFPVINEQISGFSRLYSSLNFIINEKHNIQKVIEKIFNKFDDFIKLLHKEEQLLLNLLIKKNINSLRIEELIKSTTNLAIVIIENFFVYEKKIN